MTLGVPKPKEALHLSTSPCEQSRFHVLRVKFTRIMETQYQQQTIPHLVSYSRAYVFVSNIVGAICHQQFMKRKITRICEHLNLFLSIDLVNLGIKWRLNHQK